MFAYRHFLYSIHSGFRPSFATHRPCKTRFVRAWSPFLRRLCIWYNPGTSRLKSFCRTSCWKTWVLKTRPLPTTLFCRFVWFRLTYQIPIFIINRKFVHFPIILHFRCIGIGEIDGVADLSVGTMERCNTYFPAKIKVRCAVFSPVKAVCKDVPAKSSVIWFVR